MEAYNYLTTATNMCVTTSNANDAKPYEMWYDKPLPLEQLQPFAMVGYMWKTSRKKQRELRGEKCILLRISPNHASGTLKVFSIRIQHIVDPQNVSWHPENTTERLSNEQAPQPASLRETEVRRTIESVDGCGVGRREASDAQSEHGEKHSRRVTNQQQRQNLESPSKYEE